MIAPLGACDLQPPPKQKPAPATATDEAPPSTPPPAQPALPAPDAAPPAPDAFDVTQQCLEVSAHIADILIKEQQDPAARAAIEQDKTKIIRRAAEGCTRDQWPAASLACFMKAATFAEMEICGKDLKAP